MPILLLFLLFSLSATQTTPTNSGQLRPEFYHSTCPQLEETVQAMTWARVAQNPAIPAKILRMHFHDCFVRGCDGSVLLDTPVPGGEASEKEAVPNKSLEGFDLVDQIKSAVEVVCPDLVSCADILALAARDAVSFQFRRPIWEVDTGRRDGRISRASEASAEIPSPFSNFNTIQRQFAAHNLTVRDLVALSGAHTIGRGHCSLIENRLYNFTGQGDSDPSLDPVYAAALRGVCRRNDTTTTVEMDAGSPGFDGSYFTGVQNHRGLFTSDASLLTDPAAKTAVAELANSDQFLRQFGESVKKMAAIGVLTGGQGEIRRSCRVINN